MTMQTFFPFVVLFLGVIAVLYYMMSLSMPVGYNEEDRKRDIKNSTIRLAGGVAAMIIAYIMGVYL